MRKYLFLLFLLTSIGFSAGAKYLIITADVFSGAIQPLAQWKQKKGVPTKVVTLSEIGATADSIARIKNYIVNAYNTWNPRPEYVLLVGNSSFVNTDGPSLYDDYYANVIGDYLMELSLGRLVCSSASQCSLQVVKTLSYERTPYLSDTLWYKKGTGIVNEDNAYYDSVYWNDARYIYGQWQSVPYTHIDSFSRLYGDNATSVINAINDGRTFVFYRGQGVGNWNWNGGVFTIDPSLTNNGYKLPVVVSPTCATISLSQSGSYLGHSFMNAGNTVNYKGAVAYLGTTQSASGTGLARARGIVGQHFFKSVFSDKIFKVGDALKRAKFVIDSIRPLVNGSWSSTRYREWNLLGDPELNLWTAVPKMLTVTHDTLIYAGSQTYSVTVKRGITPVSGALVCAMMDTTVYLYTTTNVSGIASFSIAPPIGIMSVTVTANNYIPYEKNVTVQPGGLTHDVSVTAILEPINTIPTGTSVYPKAKIKNYGSRTDTFPVSFRIIGTSYNQTISQVILAAGDTVTKTFPLWTSVMGSYSTKAYSSLGSDQWRGNDTAFSSFTVVAAHDVGVTAILAPTGSIYQGLTITPRAIIRNYGGNAETFSLTFKIGSVYNQTVPSVSLGIGIIDTIDFPNWVSASGTHSTQCYSQLSSDNNRNNDTINCSVTVGSELLVEGFNNETFPPTSWSSNIISGSHNWERVTSGSNPTCSPYEGAGMAFYNSYDAVSGSQARLISKPVILGSSPISLQLKFNMYHDNSYPGGTYGPDSVIVEYSFNGTTFNRVTAFRRYEATDAWVEHSIVLGSFSGTFYIAFRAYSEYGTNMYIDNVRLLPPLPGDVGVTAILAPRDTIGQDQSITPTAIIKNYGSSSETFAATMQIGASYIQQVSSITLGAGITDTIEFPNWTSSLGTYSTKCYTQLANDNNRVNDTIVSTVYVNTNYGQTFELSNGSFIANPSVNGWEWGTPTSGPLAAHSGTNLWATILAGAYTNSANWQLTSREFIATANNPMLKFWQWYNMEESGTYPGRAYDGGNIKISTDSGVTWTLIRPVGGYNGVGYTGNAGIVGESCYTGIRESWNQITFTLPLITGQRFFLKWHFGSDGGVVRSGWYIDDISGINFSAYAGVINDVGTISITAPASSVDSGITINPNAVIHNYGFNRVSLNVKFDISDGYTHTKSVSIPPSSDTLIYFNSWTARYFGTYSTKCSTRYSSDSNTGNDKAVSTVRVRFHDVGAYEIISPTGTQPTGDLAVSAKFKNYYTRSASCSTKFIIRNSSNNVVFNQSRSLTNLLPDSIRSVDFGTFSALPDKYYTKIYTVLATDDNASNDTMTDSVYVRLNAPILISPALAETLYTHTPLFDWHDVIGAYQYQIQVSSDEYFSAIICDTVIYVSQYQNPLDSLFDGIYYWRVCAGIPNSDWSEARHFFTLSIPPLPSGWTRLTSSPVPSRIPGKNVKDGGALVAVGLNLFAFRGNKSNEFYRYSSTWQLMESMPFGNKPGDVTVNKKRVGKGGGLCYDGQNKIYALKGNSTRELWAYNIGLNQWTFESYAPPEKGMKAGSGIGFKNGNIYVLAGSRKFAETNFFAYDTASNIWTALSSVPCPDGKSYKDGSCLTVLDDSIYILKGNGSANYFYCYDISTNSWQQKQTLPLVHPFINKNKKVKAGAALASSNNVIYAIKGGGINEFWSYSPGTGNWVSIDTIPRLHNKSVPKAGAALTWTGNQIYLIKGNNTNEFWQYNPSAQVTMITPLTYNATMTETTEKLTNQSLTVTPNPFNNLITIRYSVLSPTGITMQLISSTGQLIENIQNSHHSAGTYMINFCTGNISSGIYFLRYKDNNKSSEIKIIKK